VNFDVSGGLDLSKTSLYHKPIYCLSDCWRALTGRIINRKQLSATDILALATMKNAAKCDKQCELQNSVNHQNFERILRSRDMPGSMSVSVSLKILKAPALENERQYLLLSLQVYGRELRKSSLHYAVQ
jgi:hypothetical protein